jgi:signal transduction histidine kinase
MSLRAKILLYLIGIHAVLGGTALFALRGRPALLLLFELLFVGSVAVGYVLLRAFFVPLELIRTGAELMREQDFASHFREVGQHEMDELVRIYNRMIDRLREERRHLEEHQRFLERILAASPIGVITLGHDGSVAAVSPGAERLLAAGEAALAGRRPAALPAPFGPALGPLAPGESTIVVLHGRRRVVCRRASFYDRGFARGFFLLEELTAELHASERAAYDKLIRMMSHEVRNSVGAVRSLLESLVRQDYPIRQDTRAEYDHAIGVAAARLEHLNAFMNALAEVVRIPPPERRPCDLRRLVDDIALLLRPELERRRIVLDWSPPQSFPEIPLDKHQIEQVLVNVLRNAIEAIGEDGTIRVALERDGVRPRLAVRDSGPGLPPGVERELFTPFFTTKPHGQGVGLTLTREVLSQHGFDFELRNGEDGGAEFRIAF